MYLPFQPLQMCILVQKLCNSYFQTFSSLECSSGERGQEVYLIFFHMPLCHIFLAIVANNEHHQLSVGTHTHTRMCTHMHTHAHRHIIHEQQSDLNVNQIFPLCCLLRINQKIKFKLLTMAYKVLIFYYLTFSHCLWEHTIFFLA